MGLPPSLIRTCNDLLGNHHFVNQLKHITNESRTKLSEATMITREKPYEKVFNARP
jgi:hypothetical protein